MLFVDPHTHSQDPTRSPSRGSRITSPEEGEGCGAMNFVFDSDSRDVVEREVRSRGGWFIEYFADRTARSRARSADTFSSLAERGKAALTSLPLSLSLSLSLSWFSIPKIKRIFARRNKAEQSKSTHGYFARTCTRSSIKHEWFTAWPSSGTSGLARVANEALVATAAKNTYFCVCPTKSGEQRRE